MSGINRSVFQAAFLIFISVLAAGCSSGPPQEKLRFFLEAALDVNNKIKGDPLWEITDLQTVSERHPAGYEVKFNLQVKATKTLYQREYKRLLLERNGWKGLVDMVKLDPRSKDYAMEGSLGEALKSEMDYTGPSDFVSVAVRAGDLKTLEGKVLASESGSEWRFAKLEIGNIGLLNISGDEQLPADRLLIGTPEADKEIQDVIAVQRSSVDRIFEKARNVQQNRQDQIALDLDRMNWSERCKKRCAGTSIACEVACEKEFDSRRTY